MPEIDVAAYKEQVFGNGQSPTHTPTPEPTNDTPSAEPKPTEAIVEPTVVIPDAKIADVPHETVPPVVVDEKNYVKQNLGYETWEDVKKDIEALKAKASTPAQIEYANEQSKLLHEAIVAGKTDEVFEILNTQKQLAAVDTMKPAEAIKLHIAQNNKHFKQIDVEDVFEEKYSYPEKPVQDTINESDEDFQVREDKWKAAKEKIDRRVERDAATAKTELSKLAAELKLPEIQKPTPTADKAPVDDTALAEFVKLDKQEYSKISPKDISMVFKFSDEASKLAFDITYEPEKEKFDESIAEASDLEKFFANFYEKDGSPNRIKQAKAIYAAKNIDSIVSEAIVQAVNQERIRALKSQKNIGDGTQRNYTVQPPSEVDKLRQQVFG